MFRRFSVNFILFAIALDSILICISLFLATLIRPQLSLLPFAREYPELIPTPWMIYPIFAIIWIAINLIFSVYDSHKNFRLVDEITGLLLSTLLASVALAGTLYLSFREISRLLFISFILFAFLMMITWRMGIRIIQGSTTQTKRKILIIGAGKNGQQFLSEVQKNPQFGLQVIGFIDEDKNTYPNILGVFDETPSIIEELNIDDVIIALPHLEQVQISELIENLKAFPVKVWVIPDYFQLALHRPEIEQFGGIPMLDLRAPALSENQRLIKRAFDLLITIILLPLALPIMGLISLAIRLESSGSVLFRQQRIGENGVIFEVLKFRSMISGAETYRHSVEKYDDQGHLIHKPALDPRITHVGKFLRRFSLDELPQLFNVLKGEMSLVGPRPELPFLVDMYEPWQRKRFSVPPGMTGWWQITGRSNKPMHLNTEDDLYYIQSYSLRLDIYILIMTIGKVLSGEGAF